MRLHSVLTFNSNYRESEYKLSSCLGYVILVEALEVLIEGVQMIPILKNFPLRTARES